MHRSLKNAVLRQGSKEEPLHADGPKTYEQRKAEIKAWAAEIEKLRKHVERRVLELKAAKDPDAKVYAGINKVLQTTSMDVYAAWDRLNPKD